MKFENKHYRPLLEGLTIQKSAINGLGLHAQVDWKAGVLLGESHVWNDRVEDWIRTPLGGFINHSEDPNCFILTNLHDRQLYTIKPIKEGQELSVYYTIGYDDLIQ